MAVVFEVKASADEMLKGYHWEAQEAKANLCVITGMNEYAYRYHDFAEWMNAHSINVWVLDAFGQGLNVSSPEEQEKWPEDAFKKTLKAIHRMNLLAASNGLPTVQMGHSMGSFMTQALIEMYPKGTDKVILCGSNGGQNTLMQIAYGLSRVLVNKENRDKPSGFLQQLGLGGYASAVPDRRTDYDWLSYDEDNVKRYIDDPYCGHPNTGGFWREFLRGMAQIWKKKNLRRISKEETILIIAGEDDPVGQMGEGPKWLAKTYRELGVKDVELKIYSGMRHEILNEKDKERVYEDILAFINA
ncbi:MAG: alpha/beta hydrolase [Lachnospiraceae bacterium]|nr:alpha/beta hydrolase [Lachnospiraceae bacterium]